MIRVYADDELVYDSRLEDYALLGLTVTVGENTSGTAEIILPTGHPAHGAFIRYRTIVEVYRDEELLFRGRVRYAQENFYGQRTVTCEGERGFFADSVMRPYIFQSDPATIFSGVVKLHNAQVGPQKRFQVGEITVSDPNDYIRIESGQAGQTAEVLDKLVEVVGGYITFDRDEQGRRRVNWLASRDRHSAQVIEFGANLLDFTRSGAETEFATVIVPYGAQDDETGEYVNITSVNGGLDYIQDDEAVAAYDAIVKPVFFDDVTDPENLLAKARAYLAVCKLLMSTLELTAVDMHALDKDIDTFAVGDWVRVRSKPHGVDDIFQLSQRTYNLLDPSSDKVVFGKDVATLSRAASTEEKRWKSQVHRVQQSLKADLNKTSTELHNEIAAVYSSSTIGEGIYISRDGLMLQWGSFVANSGSHLLTYPQSYSSVPALQLTVETGNSGISVGFSDATNGECMVNVSNGSYSEYVHWLAIGYKN